MAQSYKVFIGASVIQFQNEVENDLVFNMEFTNPDGDKLLDLIHHAEEEKTIILVRGETKENWNRFQSHYKVIEAAGGLVRNSRQEWLFIYRNQMWDLPKGKLEPSEGVEDCAVREVAEECGIEQPKIIDALSTTYHTYNLGTTRVLKPTYWFLMLTEDESELIPQTEEGITQVKWVKTEDASTLGKNSFGSINQVVSEGLSIFAANNQNT